MTLELMLLIAGLAIIAVLGVIASILLFKVQQQNKLRAEQLGMKELAIAEQREKVNTSIQILAHAVQGDELSLTEASIRISVLLDSLGVDDDVRSEFSAFYQLREQTEHIPILEGWKNLSRKEQTSFDIQRLKHEESYRDFVLDAAVRIRGRRF